MYFIPLNQLESVELVVHALRAAGGEADCESCPARRVCMKQCLAVAEGIGRMLAEGTLPTIGEAPAGDQEEGPAAPAGKPQPEGGASHLKRIK
ncbi:radical SAM protein with 4Fe4S-binding SPASM domain [Geothermobacter ehrlichii]|uniref:Radical SAM protein with 4Fe4S-binding SPASM domain n=1 Tax=Geothermobacter ehrlichii TaxID=213224 RepID=A0A5D3WLP8_9BACT|nr:hypothetical protein [Geothermobacter ehrlichii]TYO99194.1 radical SAM protein with 4Fe4S-binding SPASM domain [Geothermobacter ehrlichii]